MNRRQVLHIYLWLDLVRKLQKKTIIYYIFFVKKKKRKPVCQYRIVLVKSSASFINFSETQHGEAAWLHDISPGGTVGKATSWSMWLQENSTTHADHSLGDPSGFLTFKSRFVTRLFHHLMYFSCPVLIFIGGRGLWKVQDYCIILLLFCSD